MNSIKRNLLSNDETLEFKTIFDINARLERLEKEQLHVFIEQLINFDIASNLCDFLAITDSKILRSTLSCLGIISESKLFYTKNVATQAIIQILQNSYLMTRQQTSDKNILAKMAFTLTAIINRANQFNIELKTICNIHQLLEFINNLNIENSTDYTYILSILNLYAVVLLKIDNFENENILSLIIKLQQDILTAAHNILHTNIDGTIESYQIFYFNIMKPIVAICYAGMKLCENDALNLNNSPDSTSNKGEDIHINRSTPIIHIICKTMLHSVIPNAKMPNIPRNESQHREILTHLVGCLSSLYERPDVNFNEFSFLLAEQGYLKYLFHFINCHEDVCECICDCIASIITDLSQIFLALDKWSDGRQGFRRFIKRELLKFGNGNQREFNCETADVSLFLCYFHFLFTRDLEILDTIKAAPLMTRIINISTDNLPEIPILQIILFLFAATALEDPTEHLDEKFPYALLKIVEILEIIGLENCYTHHPTLPCFILQNSAFPIEIRRDVVKLWLKLEDNMCHLVPQEGTPILINCLLNIVQTGAEDLIVERAMNELSRIISDSNNSASSIEQQITQFMWENLPQLLTDFMNSENNIYNYLKMLNRLRNFNVSILSAIRCSNSLITVLNCENLTINNDINTLLVKQMSKMLSVDLTAKDGRVVSVYTNNYKLLNKLCANAFSKEHDNLSAACYKCLADILHSQKQLSIKCIEPVSLRPMDLFNALLRKAHVYFDVMRFLDQIWIGEIEYPAILRPVYTEEQAKNILNGIYRMYIRIHLNTPPNQWEFTFLCLINLLKFFRQNYISVLNDSCDYLCNHSVISLAVSCNYYGNQYLKFANTWLQYGLFTRCSFVVDILRTKSRTDERQQNGIFHEIPFDEALRELDNHIQKLIVLGSLQANDVKELKSTLAIFL